MPATGTPWTPRLALSALVAALAMPAAAAAQTPAGPTPADPTPFVERIDVNVVNVEVFVVDRKGRRVTGLTRDDFELLHDGAPVPISNFFATTRRDRVLSSVPGVPESDPEVLATKDLPADQQLNFLIYVDHFNILPQNRSRVLAQLGGFLEDRAYQGDNVMIVGFDGDLDVVQPFTRDYRAIQGAVRKLDDPVGGRVRQDRELLQAMRQMQVIAAAVGGEDIQTQLGGMAQAYDVVRTYVQSVRMDLERSAKALESMIRSLSGLPGRKAILYVSDGLLQRPGEVLYQFLIDEFGTQLANTATISGEMPDPYLEIAQEDETHLYNSIGRQANAEQITLYTLSAAGADAHMHVSPDGFGLGRGAGGTRALAALHEQSLQEPLLALAESTGGTAIVNTANFDDALASMGEDFDSFYSLGFQVPEGATGEYHEIEVRVKGHPELAARHREGYRDKPDLERIGDRTYASLLFGMEKNPLNVSVDFGKPERKGKRRYHLPLLVRIPVSQITLLPQGARQTGMLRIFLIVKDESGMSELRSFPYEFSMTSAQLAEARGQDIGYGAVLELEPGVPNVAVGVYDEIGGGESFVHKQVIVDETGRRRGRR